MYPTNNVDTNVFILQDCKANILVLDDEKMLAQVACYMDKLPNLKKIILWDGEPTEASPDIMSWKDVMALGKTDQSGGPETSTSDDQPVLERQKNMAVNQCCILVYTSGTTGHPKGKLTAKSNVCITCTLP